MKHLFVCKQEYTEYMFVCNFRYVMTTMIVKLNKLNKLNKLIVFVYVYVKYIHI